jgi:hypothetical protein
MSLSVDSIVKALTSKTFKKSTADSILHFVEGMAAVTQNLKPKSLEALSKFSLGMSDFIESMSKISFLGMMKIGLMAKILFSGSHPLLKRIIEGAVGAVKHVTGKDLQKLQEAGKGISLLAEGLKTLGKALGILALIAVIAPLVIIGAATARLVIGMFVGLGKHEKEIAAGGKAIRQIGTGLIALAVGLAFMALVILIIPPKILLATMLVLAGFALVFALIGKASKYIAEGAYVMVIGMAVGLFFFAGALMIFGLAISTLGLLGVFGMISLIGAFAVVFNILGKNAKWIEAGTEAMISMAFGLGAFSIGMIMFGLSLKGIIALFEDDYVTAGIATVAIIGGMIGLFSAAGALVTVIEAGSAAFIGMGIGLVVFSIGILIFGLALKGVLALFKDDYATAALATAAIIGGMISLFSLAGLAIIPIALGSASILLMGVSLISFSIGLMMFALTTKAVLAMGLMEKDKDGDMQFKGTAIIKSIVNGFASVGNPFKVFKALLGAATAVAVGVALLVFSLGLGAVAVAVKKVPSNFIDVLFDEDNGIVYSLLVNFKKIGKQYGSFLSFGSDPVSMGVKAVKKSADALSSLAGAIVKFADVNNVPVQIADPKTGKLRWDNVSLATTVKNLNTVMIGKGDQPGLLTSIMKVFADIGKMPEVSGLTPGSSGIGSFFRGFLKRLTGSTPMQMGMRAVANIGSALEGLAGGIVTFANVDEIPVQYADSKGKLIYRSVKLSEVISNIETVMIGDSGILLSLVRIFGKIGKMPEISGLAPGETGGNFFTSLLRRLTGSTPMQLGMKAVAEVGNIIGTLAGGITAFANIDAIPIQIPDPKDPSKLIYQAVSVAEVIANIKTALIGDGTPSGTNSGLLLALANVFAVIGDKHAEGLLKPKNVSRGVKAISGVSDVLSDLSQTITAFSELKKPIPTSYDPKTGQPNAWSSLTVEEIVSNVKTALIGDGTPSGTNSGLLLALANVFAVIGDKHAEGLLKPKNVKRGADAVAEVGNVLSGLSQTILAFAQLQTLVPDEFDEKTGKPKHWSKISMKSITDNIISFLTVIPQAFADLSKDEDMLDIAENNAEKLKGVIEIVGQMVSPLKGLTSLMPKAGDKNAKGVLTLLSEEISNFFNYLSKNPITDATISSLNKLIDVFTRFSAISSPFKEFSNAFKDFNKSFGSFGTNVGIFSKNFKGFSPQLKNYEKFAAVLNGHAYYAPRFEQFEGAFKRMASDLKPFAENFKLMDTKTIEAFRFWTEALTSFVKIDPETFQSVADQISKLKDVLPKEEKKETNIAATSTTPAFLVPPTLGLPQSPPVQANTARETEQDKKITALMDAISGLTTALAPLSGLETTGEGLLVRFKQ